MNTKPPSWPIVSDERPVRGRNDCRVAEGLARTTLSANVALAKERMICVSDRESSSTAGPLLA